MGINDCEKCAVEAKLDSRSIGFAVAQFFANALENKDVRVHAHADGKNHARNARKSEHSSGKRHKRNQDHEVEDQCYDGVDAAQPVINHQEYHDHNHAADGRAHAFAD